MEFTSAKTPALQVDSLPLSQIYVVYKKPTLIMKIYNQCKDGKAQTSIYLLTINNKKNPSFYFAFIYFL